MPLLIPTKRSHPLASPIDQWVKQFFDESIGTSATDVRLAPIHVQDDDQNVYVTIDLPGVDREDVAVHFREGVLTVSGEKRTEVSDEKRGTYIKEISYGKFSRSVRLGDVDFDHAQAKLDKGQLRITVPKIQEVQAKKLDIH